MSRRILPVWLMISILLPGVVGAATPEPEAQPQTLLPAGESPQQEPAINRREASDLVRSRYQGRILSIRLENNRWRVRMDNEGTVFNVFVDSRSGQVSGPDQ